jgi:hemolysin activation/secretion protein
MTALHSKLLLAVMLGFLACASSAFAEQEVPEAAKAGVIEKEISSQSEVSRETERKIPLIEIKLPKEEMAFPEGVEVDVKEIQIRGNTVVKTEVLDQIAAKYENKKLNFRDLMNVTEDLTQQYVKRGYFLSKAYLPVQEIKDGVLTIEIVEGKVGEIQIAGNKYYSSAFIHRYVKATKHGVIHHGQLLRSLILLNEFPNLSVRLVLARGKKPETADLIIVAKDSLPLSLSYDYNNFGSRFVSRVRQGLQASYNNLFLPGDQINLRGVVGAPAKALRYGRIEYLVPINGYGTKLGGSVTTTDFRAQREFKQFKTEGDADIYTLTLKHPLRRTRLLSIDGEVNFDVKQITNHQEPVTLDKDNLRILREQVSFDWVDRWQGRSIVGAELSNGLGIFNASPQDYSTMSRPGAGGEFMKMNISYSRVQKLPWSSFLLLRGMSQISWDQLPSSEELSIGGADSVRGFPQSTFLGDYGINFSAEFYTPPPFIADVRVPILNKKVRELMQLVFFFDHGSAYLTKAPVQNFNNLSLSSIGPGLRFNFPYGVNVRMDMGYPLGGPNPNDQSESTFYLQVTKNMNEEIRWIESLFRK